VKSKFWTTEDELMVSGDGNGSGERDKRGGFAHSAPPRTAQKAFLRSRLLGWRALIAIPLATTNPDSGTNSTLFRDPNEYKMEVNDDQGRGIRILSLGMPSSRSGCTDVEPIYTI
jgi:hypothetical protein